MQGVDRLREVTLDRLARHFAAGHLTLGTLEHRLDAALHATSSDALADVTWDLPPLRSPSWQELRAAFTRYWRAPRCTRIAFDVVPQIVVTLEDEPRTWVLGRSSSADLVLSDPQVSREHALLSIRGGRCSVRDLASRNRTWLNGKPVSTAALRPGDTLRFGPVEAQVL